jgi:hypothetical protein
MQMLVLPVVCSCYFGQETSNHLDDVFDGHATNFILWTLIADLVAIFCKGMHLVVCQGLDVPQVANLDALG